jgi:hypothetical protein
MRYDAKGAKGSLDALINTSVIGADIKSTLSSAGIMMHPGVKSQDRARAAAVAVAFGNISMAKFLISIW